MSEGSTNPAILEQEIVLEVKDSDEELISSETSEKAQELPIEITVNQTDDTRKPEKKAGLEFVGAPRALKNTTKILTGLFSTIKLSKPLQIVSVRVNGTEAFVLTGKHQLAVTYGPLIPVEVSLWFGPSRTFEKHSEPAYPASKVKNNVTLERLRNYIKSRPHASIPFRKGVVLGFSRDSTDKLALKVSNYP